MEGIEAMEAVERLEAGRTTLIIAHRLSTIRGANRIVVLREGRIVEQGTHDQLLSLGGVYSALYTEQTGERQQECPKERSA